MLANVMERRPPKPILPESDIEDKHEKDMIADEHSQSPAETKAPERKEDPPLPIEEAQPLPDEPPPRSNGAPPTQQSEDGWDPVWDDRAHAFYFYNRITQVSQWENPRVPNSTEPGPPGVANHDREIPTDPTPAAVYNPAIHGDYDPNADYAKPQPSSLVGTDGSGPPGTGPTDPYAATGAFNRFTGKWQSADITTEKFSDEAKSKRQMNAFFDVDAAANSHNGKSLRAERQQKKLSKQELKAFKEKRREKKEEKRRAWLKD